jgi:hypothetical protein
MSTKPLDEIDNVLDAHRHRAAQAVKYGVNFVNDGSAMAGNSVNDVTSNARFYDLSPIATATVSVVAHGVRRAV